MANNSRRGTISCIIRLIAAGAKVMGKEQNQKKETKKKAVKSMKEKKADKVAKKRSK